MPRGRHNRKKSKMSFNKKVLKVIDKQAEKKNLDQSEDATSIVAGTPFNMSIGMPAQGDTDLTRDGDQIRLKSIRFRGKLSLLAPATEGALIRFLVLRLPSTNQDGSAPIADFTGMTPNGFFPRQLPYPYKVLSDKTFALHIGANNMRLIRYNISVNNQLIQFDGSGVNDIVNYRYFVLGVTEHATASEMTCQANTRVIYTDG